MVDYFAVLASISGIALVFSNSIKKTILLSWITTLIVGAEFLSEGSELIGLMIILQASISSYVLFSITQGMKIKVRKNHQAKWVLGLILQMGIVASLVYLEIASGPFWSPEQNRSEKAVDSLSLQLLEKHFLSAEVLLVAAFIVLIGLGLNLRGERQK